MYGRMDGCMDEWLGGWVCECTMCMPVCMYDATNVWMCSRARVCVCVCVSVCVRVRVRVCNPVAITRLRIKIMSFFKQGVQSTVETAPNEAIHFCWKQSLIKSVYLLFPC